MEMPRVEKARRGTRARRCRREAARSLADPAAEARERARLLAELEELLARNPFLAP